MQTVNMLQAKSSLSPYYRPLSKGKSVKSLIARNGRPVAKLVPLDTAPSGKRIGVAKGLFVVPDSIDTHNHEVARLFMGEV